MKKNNLFTLAACACALLLSACSNEIDTAGNPDRAGAGEAIVTVSLEFPQADKPSGYAPGDLGDDVLPGVALDAEKEIKSIAFVAFTPGGTSVYLSENPTLTDNGFTKPLTPVDAAIPGEYTATFKIKSGNFDGNTTIIAIANYKENGLTIAADPSLDDVKKMLSVALAEQPDKDFITYPLLMTASYDDKITEGDTKSITFKMERIMARVDVVNNAYDKTTKENDFVLTSARLISAPTQGTMIAGQTGVAPSGYIQLKVQDDVKEILPADGQPVSPTNPAKQQLAPMYVYENSNTDKTDATKLSATATYVEVIGTYKGAAYKKTIAFKTLEKVENGAIVGGEIVPIARNTRYVVDISSSKENELVFDVKVTDWQEGKKLDVAIDFAEPVLEGIDGFTAPTGATWDAVTQTLNITKATDAAEFNLIVRGFQDSDFRFAAEYDANATPLAKTIAVERGELGLTGYADASAGDKDKAPLARTYKVTIPPYTGECPSLTKIIVYNAAYADAQTEITVRYAPVFIGDLKTTQSGTLIDQDRRLISLNKASTVASTFTFFASCDVDLATPTVDPKNTTANFYTFVKSEPETNMQLTGKYGPGKRITMSYKALTDAPQLGEVSVYEKNAAPATAKKLFVKCFKKPIFESYKYAPNADNALAEGNKLYLAVNNGDHGTIDYTVYDNVAYNAVTLAPIVTYATTVTSPNWATTGLSVADGDVIETVSESFQLVKRIVKVTLPKVIKNPAEVTSFKVGIAGEPALRLTPIYLSGVTITAADKLLVPVLVKTVWWSPVNIGQTKISSVNDPSSAAGYLFQWGRKQPLTWDSPLKDGPVDNAADAGIDYVISNSTNRNDWLKVQNDQLWNSGTEAVPIKTVYDPCPVGWRVPSETECDKSLIGTHGWQSGGASPTQNGLLSVTGVSGTANLHIQPMGLRNLLGEVHNGGKAGYYYTSTVSGDEKVRTVHFANSVCDKQNAYRATCMPVRCVQE